MSFHRFIATCNPLHYMSALVGNRMLDAGLAATVGGFGVPKTLAFLLECLPLLCQSPLSSVLSAPRHNEADICRHLSPCFVWSVCYYLSHFGVDSLLNVISYVMSWTAIISATSQGQNLKALKTCVSCVSAVSTIHWFGEDLPLLLTSSTYLSVPLVLDSLIYRVNNKDI